MWQTQSKLDQWGQTGLDAEEESRIPNQTANDYKYVLRFLVFTFPTPILFDPKSLPLAVHPPSPHTPPALAPFLPWTMALGAFLLAGLMAGITALGPLLRPKG